MSLGHIKSIHRYPVKSMMGESLARAKLGAQGIPGDRAWAVKDEVRGGIRGGKRFPELMRCAARYDSEPPEQGSAPATVTLPDGRALNIDDAAMPKALSGLLESTVSVWPLMPPDQLEHYRRGPPLLEDREAELRRVFARTEEEPLPDLGAFPSELFQFESPPGTYFDAFPLLIMTRQSLDTLQSLAGDHTFDVRRFRPNILIDAIETGDGFPEREWVGKSLHLGEATIEITMSCPRCAMTTYGFADLANDPGIMRTLVRDAGGDLGVYATVSTPGAVALGDPVSLS